MDFTKLSTTDFLLRINMRYGMKDGGILLNQIDNLRHYFDKDGVFKFFNCATLGSGKMFGELGLINNKRRAATIICTEDTYFAVLSKEDYDRILLTSERRRLYQKISFFRDCLFNEDLDITALSSFAYYFKEVTYK